ncbi:MAG: DUF1207 domain-containing protein [Longimicrobiales bacterium]
MISAIVSCDPRRLVTPPPLLLLVMAAALLPSTAFGQTILGATRCLPGVHADEAEGAIAFPDDAIFCPLLADPKQPRSFLSLLRGSVESAVDDVDEEVTIGAIGIGDRIGLLRSGGIDGVQLDLEAAVFAQFDLGVATLDLINADYLVALPITLRRGGFSTRLRLYHQSSHLGDEFLLRAEDPERENLSFESLELILSQEAGPLRVYAGGEVLFNREPEDLASRVAHAGIELRSAGALRMVGGLDMKSSEEQDWKPAWSGRLGLEFSGAGAAGHPSRIWSILAEAYSGPTPYGQFFREKMQYFGVGLHLTP